MTFPQTPLDVHVEMLLGSTFTQIQAAPNGVRGSDNIVITRGRADEQASDAQQPSTCLMSLNNHDGRWSPKNISGPHYGQLGRNTPIRVSTIGDGTTYCRVPGRYGLDYASCPDAAGLHITGDIDIRIDVTLDNALQYQVLAVKGDWGNAAAGTATNLAWVLYLGGSGNVRFRWSSDGVTPSVAASTANLTRSQNGTQVAIRVTLAVASGTVTFYTAPNISGSWTQLGSTTVAGATSIFASTAAVQVGEIGTSAFTPDLSIMAGRLHALQVLSGIGGTAKANPNFDGQAVGTTSFADAAGNTWTLNGQMEITNRRYRFHGEVSNWPPKQDISGNDAWVPIEAAGILRRYQQGSAPLVSPIRRAVTNSTLTPLIYWPCEDPAGAGSFAVAAGTGSPMLISGTPTLATDSHIGGSAPLPTVSNSTWTGTVPAYTAPSPNSTQTTFVLYLNTAPANGAVIARTVSGATRFDVGYTTATGGGLWINAYDSSSGSLLGSDNSGTNMGSVPVGSPVAVEVQVYQTGANLGYGIFVYDTTGNGDGQGATLTSRTLGNLSKITIDPGAALTDTVVGHIAVYKEASSVFGIVITPPQVSVLSGKDGETAASRFVRLCMENGVPVRTIGDVTNSSPMGPQGTDTFVNLLQACINADGGLLYEPRDVLGVGIYQRTALMSQTAVASPSISSHQLSAVPEPAFDDQLVRNDVTVTRTNGSYARATLAEGALSVLDPPEGVGTYPDTPEIDFHADSQLLDEASWRMHAGTVDEFRWPVATVGMHTPEMVANPTLAQQMQTADIGNVLTITGIAATVQPDDASQLIQGTAETLSNYEFTIAFNCSPASPYDVVVLDDATFGRLDDVDDNATGSTLRDATINNSVTTFQVDIPAGAALWTTADTPFTVVMDGERMTVGAVSGSATPQTFSSVTRGPVAISHTAGAAITLFRPMYLSTL
jgi:hypothetical protein